jgi:hypothetical protein
LATSASSRHGSKRGLREGAPSFEAPGIAAAGIRGARLGDQRIGSGGPERLQADLGALGGQLFSLGRTAADFERYIAAVDLKALERKLRESKGMAVVSRRAGVEADALTEHLARFDSLATGARSSRLSEPRRRRLCVVLAETSAATPMPSARTSALCAQVEGLEREVRTQLEEVRGALGDLGIALKRTRQRGVYRAGHRYGVPFYNEVGTEERRQFSSLDEATAFRRAVRLGADARLEPEKDWKTVGKTFRATDALPGAGPSYVRPTGRSSTAALAWTSAAWLMTGAPSAIAAPERGRALCRAKGLVPRAPGR